MSQGERRLAAIMFTDMVGYTALGQSNEPLSLALIAEYMSLLRPIFGRHRGREIKTMGDAFLVELPSALDAVRCAYDIQRASREFNISMSGEKRIRLRVGVHIGDVVETGGDIFGDAVNIASRIEALAPEGGICLTQQIYDQVQNKFELQLASLGKRTLKNVATPVEVYRIVLPWDLERAAGEQPLETRRVAVLPLVSFSADPQDEFFADGLTEELIDRLCQIKELEVIARTSVMVYKKKEKKAAEIGRELRAGALVEGSVRKAGNKIRVTAQLIDANTEGHLWSSRYDKDLQDIFGVQSDIAEQVAEALRVRLLPSERKTIEKRPTESTEAYTLYLKGRYYWNERSKNGLLKAVEYFSKAIEIDPEYALAYSGRADCYTVLRNNLEIPYGEAFPKAKEDALKAVQLDDLSGEVHVSLANVLGFYYDWAGVEVEYRKAMELNPNYATGHQWYGNMLLKMGRFDESLGEVLLAQRLDPLSPIITVNCGDAYLQMKKYDLAEEQYRKALELSPSFIWGHGMLSWLYLQEGKYDLAEKEVNEFLRLTNNGPRGRGYLAVVKAYEGKREEAIKILDEVSRARSSSYVPNDAFIIAYLRLGEKEMAIELIQEEFEEHANWLPDLAFDSVYSSVKSDPRIVEILKKIGLGS